MTVAANEIDAARVKAAPAVFARRRVPRGENADASIVIIQQGSTVGVNAGETVEVEGVGPEGAARRVGPGRALADGEGIARAVGDAGDPFKFRAVPVVDAVQKTSRVRIVLEVYGHFA